MSCKQHHQQQQQQQEKAGIPLYAEADGEVYMLIRFRNDMDQRMRNAFVVEKGVMSQYSGKLLGIADSVTVLESKQRIPTDVGFAIVKFRNQFNADLWLKSDRIFKQQDWPNPMDTLEIALFPLSYVPKENGYKVFQLTEIYDVRDRNFQDNYVNRVAPLMDKLNIRHGLVATTNAVDLRRTWIDRKSFVLLNSFESVEQFNEFYDSPQYANLKKFRQENCHTTSVLFSMS